MGKLVKKIKRICSIIILMLFIFDFLNVPRVVSAATILSVPTSVKAASSSYNSINISWNGVIGASGYAVYRATSSTGTYTLILTTAARNYNNTGLTTGRTYYYKIRAYRTSGTTRIYGSYSSKVSAKPIPSAPASVKAASSSYNSISVSWNGVTGASGYAVYRATSSTGTYTLITATNARSYNNTGLTTGRTYYYKIRAYRTSGTTRIYGSYSSRVSAKPIPSAPASVKAVSSSYNSINVSWNGVTGASGYEVYKAASSIGTYTLMSRTSAASCNSAGLTTNSTYYYKVRAYRLVGGSKVYSNFSSAVNARPVPSAPTSVKIVSSSCDSINLSWSGVTGASGYEAHKATSKTGTYSLVSVGPSANFTNTGLPSGTTYYYKVRAYRILGSSKVYSNFSSVISGATAVVNVTSVSLNNGTAALTLGDTVTLTATISPANATNKAVKWITSDNTVATVDNTGKITAVSAGKATITVTTADGSKTANCSVTVNNIKGIDVSKWQGTIDWTLVKGDGVQFAMIRSSYGDGTSGYKNNGVDPMFETNYAAAKANGIAVGVYHYSYAATVAQAAAEASFFISQLKGKQLDYPVSVDLEDPSQRSLDKETLTDIALTYLNMLKQAGYYPMIYTSKYWFTSVLDDTRLTSYDHWLAQWNTSITYTGTVGIWQYSSTGTVNGIIGSVDMDTSFVDYASKIKLLHLNGF